VVVGRSELFTENFLVPTTAVIAQKSSFPSLLKLWSLTLIGNLVGAIVVAKFLSLEFYDGVPAVHAVQHIQHVAEFLTIERDWDASFYSAIFAGWLITLMTWLLLTTDNTLSKIAIIWCVGFMIMLNKFNHVIVNASEVLMSIFAGNPHVTYSMWIQNNFLPTILGNMIGGLVFVTLLEYIKVLYSQERWK
jgi:formate/nitrite transporter FocA (FNT family)